MTNDILDDDSHGVCERAEWGECGGEITFDPDPYASEIYDDNTPVWMCESCRIESSMDI